jgi:hypothetical protein
MAQLPSQSQFGDYGEWPGRDVLDSGGERLGGVREIYLDRETGRPEWVLVDVDSDEARFVPLADASVESSTIRVAHTADAIRKAPGIGAEPRIDQSEERRLYAHYGLGYVEGDSGSGPPPEEPTREHEQRASGPTPTAWGAPDASPEESATPTGWGSAKPEEDVTSPWGTEEDKPAPFAVGETPNPWGTPAAKAEAPVDPWGKPKAEEPAPAPPWRADTEEPATSWSAAADAEPTNLAPPAERSASTEAEPTNLAPPPAEPPSPAELDAADIPEPSIVAELPEDDKLAATSELTDGAATAPVDDPVAPPAETAAPVDDVFTPIARESIDDPVAPSVPDDVVAPSSAGEILGAGAAAADLTAQPGPDTVRPFTPPAPPRIHSVPPPADEPTGTAVGVLEDRKAMIAAGLGIALILLFVLRRLR